MKRILTAALALAACAVLSDRPLPVGAETHSTTTRSSSGNGYTYGSWRSDDADGPNDEFQYALVEPGEHETMIASDADAMGEVARVQDEAKRTSQRLWWFRLEGRSYLVRDRDETAQAAKILAPIQELGARQGKLGAEQGRWGAMQGELGALQGRIGALQAQIALANAYASSDADRRDTEDLERQVRELRDQARELGDEQRSLGEKQRALGERQGELGRRQAVASKHAFGDLKALAKEAVANGRAESYGR
jgi:hypothetical protein